MNGQKPSIMGTFVAGSWFLLCTALLGASGSAQSCAQIDPALPGVNTSQDQPAVADPLLSLFHHPNNTRWWLSGQINVITQGHPSFRARYSGPNSLRANGESRTSQLLTLYAGLQVTPTTEIIFDPEIAAGRGVSDALGLAGFTDLDVVRNPDLGQTPYMARFMLRQIIPLSKETIELDRTPISLATTLPVRRLELRLGKFSLVDFFDINSVGSDSHLQFMNWVIDNNGAYDYAADTRGYTKAAMLEFDDRFWSVRFAEALMPKVANGIDLVWNLKQARAENLEFEFRGKVIPHRGGVLRVLSYVNHANMGNYQQAIANFLAGQTPVPDITAHPFGSRVKYGFGVNLEQQITASIRAHARLGWNDGNNESFAYTEVDRAASFGAISDGSKWRRKYDRLGVTVAINGLSAAHRQYLALGGKGFLLGDGALNYGHEAIIESFYTIHLWRGVFASFDLQHINNPGYNRDRGPVLMPSMRLHLDL